MKSNESKGVLNALESFIDKYKLPIILVLAVCLVILPFLMPNDYLMRVLIIIMLYIGFGFGLNMILGEMGLMSLGQAGFVGVGAYTAAICLTKLGWNFIPASTSDDPNSCCPTVITIALLAHPLSRFSSLIPLTQT